MTVFLRQLLLAGLLLFSAAMSAQAETALPPATARFVPIELAGHVGGLEPVLSVKVGADTKIYPLRILALHGVINDQVGGQALALTYCGPCGTVAAFNRPKMSGAPLSLTGMLSDAKDKMTLQANAGGVWNQETGDLVSGLPESEKMLMAAPAQVLSMARVRQNTGAGEQVLVMRDTQLSRVPTPKVLALPGATTSSSDMDTDEIGPRANNRVVLDARSWSLDLLAPERKLGNEDRLILLEDKKRAPAAGPPAP